MSNSPYSLLELQKRYLIDLEELNLWLETLNIQIIPSADAVDRHAQVDEKDISLLDALHRHLIAGGRIDNFPGTMLPDIIPNQDLSPQQGNQLQVPPQQSISPHAALLPTQAYSSEEEIEDSLSIPQMRQRFEFLDDCAARLWLLTTGQVCKITGLKPSTLLSRAKAAGDCQWQSWSFSRAGRQGRESLWKVSSPRISSSVAIEVASAKSRNHPHN